MPSSFAVYPSLKDMPVVISGGASGIGESLVREFAAQGSRVGFVDIAAERGRALEAELRAAGHTVSFEATDITDVEAYQATIRGFEEKHGPAMALLNNAANDMRINPEDITSEFWDQAIAVNLKHQFFAAQAVMPGMKAANRGSIINFGSISWMISASQLAAYTASKAAAHGMARSLARDLGKYSIRVNTLVPGWIMTEKQLTTWVTPESGALIDAQQTIKGRLYPEDISRMALFLAADDSKMITGQQFLVDGGWASS